MWFLVVPIVGKVDLQKGHSGTIKNRTTLNLPCWPLVRAFIRCLIRDVFVPNTLPQTVPSGKRSGHLDSSWGRLSHEARFGGLESLSGGHQCP